jgi:hypothetical protein
MARTLEIACIGLTGVILAACGDSRASDRDLLARYPGSIIFENLESAPPRPGRGLPDCLRAQADVMGRGVEIPEPEARPDGAHNCKREGPWVYAYVRTEHSIAPDGSTHTHYSDFAASKIGVEAEGEYVHNKLQGTWTYWHPNGRKRATGRFVDDAMTGPWQFWLESGEPDLVHSGMYEENVIVPATPR